MPSRFKNTTSASWADKGTTNHIWRFDRFGITPITVECTFETYPVDIEVFTGNFDNGDRTGQIDCNFANYPTDIEIFTATYIDTSVNGDIDCVGLEPTIVMQAGLQMDCTFDPLTFLSFFYIDGDEVDNCVFREMTLEAYGNAWFNILILRTDRLTLEMYEASDMTCEFEDIELQMTAVNGVISSMNCVGQRPSCTFTSVPTDGIDLEFEEPTIEIEADTPILANLIGTTRYFDFEIEASTPWHSSMEIEFRHWSYTSYVNVSAFLFGQLQATFIPLQGDFYGIKGVSGNLACLFRNWQLEMTASTDGVNEVIITLPEFEAALDMGGIPGSETCETAEDLEYEEVL